MMAMWWSYEDCFSGGMEIFKATSKICSYARSGFIKLAREWFDKMPERDTVAWNAMITGYAHLGIFREAMSLFSEMRMADAKPDHFTFTVVLSASADVGNLNCGRRFHALVVSSGFGSSLPVCNSLIDMYGKCSCPPSALGVFEQMREGNVVSWCSLLFAYVRLGDFRNARRSFDEMPVRKAIAWNILISGYSQLGEIEMPMELFKEMRVHGEGGDPWTFSSLMNACTKGEEMSFGFMVHAFVIKSGWNSSTVVSNSILSFYSNFEWSKSAHKIFESMEIRTPASWNAMIDAHMKVGDVGEALCLFTRAPDKNVVSWTSMIAGYVRNGNGKEALALFVAMMKDNLRPDELTFGSVLHACSILAILGYGRVTHGFVIRNGFASYVYVGNGLVNMYAKCGDIGSSIQVFDQIHMKDRISWNTMLFAFTLHGCALKALNVYREMVVHDILPDKVTFIGLLMACSHSGLIEEGHMLFKMMKSIHGLSPEEDHMTCMIDMLGRAGRLNEVMRLLKDVSKLAGCQTTDSSKALLGACTLHGELGIAMNIGEELVTVEPYKEVGYVMLSNMYCANGEWGEAEKVRKAMIEQGVKKLPGCSWIEVRNTVFIFASGTCYPSHVQKVRTTLSHLDSEMRNPCFY